MPSKVEGQQTVPVGFKLRPFHLDLVFSHFSHSCLSPPWDVKRVEGWGVGSFHYPEELPAGGGGQGPWQAHSVASVGAVGLIILSWQRQGSGSFPAHSLTRLPGLLLYGRRCGEVWGQRGGVKAGWG